MDYMNERENSTLENPDDGTLHGECIRLVECGNVRRFESLALKFDLVQYELSDEVSKPLIFYAIERNDETFVKVLLGMEIPLDKRYSIMMATIDSPEGQLVKMSLTAYEFARELNNTYLAKLIYQYMNLASYERRFVRILKLNDTRRCETFLRRLHNHNRENDYAKKGLFYAAQFGSVRLLDHFLTRWKIDVNTQQQDENDYPTTALLTSIRYNQSEAAKFLLFRQADPSIKGQYDNALVTALHYHAKSDLLRVLLDKHVDLTVRHPDYEKINLREYCVLTNRVKAKIEIDAYIIRLINNGNYQRLKWLVEHNYTYINVHVNPKRTARQLAKKRYYDNIVKLIDYVENTQKKAKIKMNY